MADVAASSATLPGAPASTPLPIVSEELFPEGDASLPDGGNRGDEGILEGAIIKDAEEDATDEDEEDADEDGIVIVAGKGGAQRRYHGFDRSFVKGVPFQSPTKPVTETVELTLEKKQANEELKRLRYTHHRTAFDVDIDALEQQPWRNKNADISDYFNYGFNEQTWQIYCERQLKVRMEKGLGPTQQPNPLAFANANNINAGQIESKQPPPSIYGPQPTASTTTTTTTTTTTQSTIESKASGAVVVPVTLPAMTMPGMTPFMMPPPPLGNKGIPLPLPPMPLGARPPLGFPQQHPPPSQQQQQFPGFPPAPMMPPMPGFPNMASAPPPNSFPPFQPPQQPASFNRPPLHNNDNRKYGEGNDRRRGNDFRSENNNFNNNNNNNNNSNSNYGNNSKPFEGESREGVTERSRFDDNSNNNNVDRDRENRDRRRPPPSDDDSRRERDYSRNNNNNNNTGNRDRERTDRDRTDRERTDRERTDRERGDRERGERERGDRERGERERNDRSDRDRGDRDKGSSRRDSRDRDRDRDSRRK